MSNLESDRGEFPTVSLDGLRQRVRHARAMLRAVMGAIEAVADGSVNVGSMSMDVDADAQRWSLITAAAREELIAVRDTAMNSTVDTIAGTLDWYTPLAQIEALNAALWYDGCRRTGERLESWEIFDAAEAIVGSLDVLLEQSLPPVTPRVNHVAAVPA
ncbi:MAG: hypothetical protein K2Y15_10630 [Burkholderiaceae bacterium]|nr:hypothetical protein [Burkholderiaceae bacterium]